MVEVKNWKKPAEMLKPLCSVISRLNFVFIDQTKIASETSELIWLKAKIKIYMQTRNIFFKLFTTDSCYKLISSSSENAWGENE